MPEQVAWLTSDDFILEALLYQLGSDAESGVEAGGCELDGAGTGGDEGSGSAIGSAGLSLGVGDAELAAPEGDGVGVTDGSGVTDGVDEPVDESVDVEG